MLRSALNQINSNARSPEEYRSNSTFCRVLLFYWHITKRLRAHFYGKVLESKMHLNVSKVFITSQQIKINNCSVENELLVGIYSEPSDAQLFSVNIYYWEMGKISFLLCACFTAACMEWSFSIAFFYSSHSLHFNERNYNEKVCSTHSILYQPSCSICLYFVVVVVGAVLSPFRRFVSLRDQNVSAICSIYNKRTVDQTLSHNSNKIHYFTW